jgi:hypothetical protein|tara:strand:+ start:561 stop:1466 length:906 start_codon:yes stop_codon:yes gene_type:complete
MNEIVTINTENYSVMAKAMGLAGESSDSKSSNLARLKLQHKNIMGEKEVGDEIEEVVKIKAGSYKLDVPDDTAYYAKEVTIRPFMQRFMYKRFVKNTNAKQGEPLGIFHKTIMADNLNIDLKDNQGTFNCGKPSGYIKDFASLPADMQNLIKQIKRVRVLFGLITMKDMKTETEGKLTEVKDLPFIWEIDNREAFKIVGKPFATLSTMRKLPVQHNITALGDPRALPSGDKFYVPKVMLDTTNTITLSDKDQTTFTDFVSWIENYNTYIMNMWDEKVNSTMSTEDENTVDQFVQIDNQDVA